MKKNLDDCPASGSPMVEKLNKLLKRESSYSFWLTSEKYYKIDCLGADGYKITFTHKINDGEQVFTYFLNAEGEPIREVDPWEKETEYIQANKELIRGMIGRVLEKVLVRMKTQISYL